MRGWIGSRKDAKLPKMKGSIMTEVTIKADKPVVFIPIDEYDWMRETIEILSNPRTVRNIINN